MFIQLAQSSFIGYPNLVKIAKVAIFYEPLKTWYASFLSPCRLTGILFFQAKIEAIKQEKESAAESMLRTQFKMELIVYSQDRTYSCSLSECKREEEEEEAPTLSQKHHKERSLVYSTDNHATLQELMTHLKSYYKVSFNIEMIHEQKHTYSRV